MPLAWAHAEYIQLVRSAADGRVFGVIPEVAKHYGNRRRTRPLEIWKFNRQVRIDTSRRNSADTAASLFRLHWTCDEWERP